MPPVEVEEQYQKVEEDRLLENYSFLPEFVRKFFISNVITRSFAHLIGWSLTGAKRLVCTTAGVLKVATIGTGFEHNDTKTGTAADAYGTALAFDSVASRIDIWIDDNPATIKKTPDNITWDDEIKLKANRYYSFDCTTHSINIKNTTAGANATYQIVGWF